jgi:hypothetical protein
MDPGEGDGHQFQAGLRKESEAKLRARTDELRTSIADAKSCAADDRGRLPGAGGEADPAEDRRLGTR